MLAISEPRERPAHRRTLVQIEDELRGVLRQGHDSAALGSHPLSQAICSSTGIADPRDALRAVIRGAFAGAGRETRLRDLLLRGIEQRESVSSIQESLGVSKRHVHRRKTKAIAIVATYLKELLDSSIEEQPERESLDPLERIAELVAHARPDLAASLCRLDVSLSSAAKSARLSLRSRAERAIAIVSPRDFSSQAGPLLPAIFAAQSEETNGRAGRLNSELWSLFRAERQFTALQEARFELGWLGFLRARHSGKVREIDSTAKNLRRLAGNQPHWGRRSLLASAEAALCSGKFTAAGPTLDAAEQNALAFFAITDLASAALLRGELALVRGEDADAARLASGAHLVLSGQHANQYRCQQLLARAHLRLGQRWLRPDSRLLSRVAWGHVALDIEAARHDLARRNVQKARSTATVAFHSCRERGYLSLAARAAATLGGTFAEDLDTKYRWYLQALGYLMITRDRSVGCDLFAFDQDDVASKFCDANFINLASTIYSALISSFPILRSEESMKSVHRFIDALVAATLNPVSRTRFRNAALALGREAPWFAQYFIYFVEDIAQLLHALFQAIVEMKNRQRAEYNLNTLLRELSGLLRPPSNPRNFYVGTPTDADMRSAG